MEKIPIIFKLILIFAIRHIGARE